MKKLVCIVCPNSCELEITQDENGISVRGNKCKRGVQFAADEMTAPKRTISSVVKTAFKSVPVLPVRVSAEIPKDKIFDVMNEINHVTLKKRVKRGEVIIKNVLSLGVDIIATSDVLSTVPDSELPEVPQKKTAKRAAKPRAKATPKKAKKSE